MSLNNIVPLPSALCPLVPENKCDEYFSTGAGVGRSLSPGAQTEWARTVGWTAVQSSGANSVRTDLPVRVVSSNVWVNYICILYLLYLSLIFIISFFNKYQDNYSWEMSYDDRTNHILCVGYMIIPSFISPLWCQTPHEMENIIPIIINPHLGEINFRLTWRSS